MFGTPSRTQNVNPNLQALCPIASLVEDRLSTKFTESRRTLSHLALLPPPLTPATTPTLLSLSLSLHSVCRPPSLPFFRHSYFRPVEATADGMGRRPLVWRFRLFKVRCWRLENTSCEGPFTRSQARDVPTLLSMRSLASIRYLELNLVCIIKFLPHEENRVFLFFKSRSTYNCE